jgi:hypothetical protein
MSELWSQFLQHRGHLCQKWAHYFPIYERHFARFQNTACTVLEIGVDQGGSLQMWKRYFGPLATIVGIDIEPKCKAAEEDQIHVEIGHQRDAAFLAEVVRRHGAPDIVIDDGSHKQNDVNASFDVLYSRLDPRGVYLVEDLHTAYWEEYGGGSGQYTFIERVKALIDMLNAYSTRDTRGAGWFTETTDSIHIYDSIVVIEKGPHPPPRKVMSGSFNK